MTNPLSVLVKNEHINSEKKEKKMFLFSRLSNEVVAD